MKKNKKIFRAVVAAALVAAAMSFAHAVQPSPAAVGSGVEFTYEAGAKSGRISVAGEFNGWDPAKDFLKFDVKRGLWSTILPLTEGRHEYKFVVGGQWMDGPNLVLELKKKDGRLLVVERPSANTPYSGKIVFSGKFISETGVAKERGAPDYSSSEPINHLDMDWRVAAAKELRAFARLEYDSSSAGPVGIRLKQSALEFDAGEVSMEAAYKKKAVVFDNPLKVTDRNVSLKYDAPEFFDETNPHKAFGLWEQTLFARGNFSGGRLAARAFVSDMTRPATDFHSVEDNYGWRATYLFVGAPLKAGLTARSVRGGWWPWANTDNHWFPDPETQAGYSWEPSARGSAATWYKGYTESDFTSADAAFYFLPWLTFFGEAGVKNTSLRTQRVSGDAAYYKTWRFLDEATTLVGGKIFSGDSFAVELRAENRNIALAPPLYPDERIKASGSALGGAARFRSGGFSAAVSAVSDKNSPISKDIPLDIHPYSRDILSVGLFPHEKYARGGRLVAAVVENISVMPHIGYDSGPFSVGLKSRLRALKVLPKTYSGGVTYAAALPPEELNTSETMFDVSAAVAGPLRAEASARFVTWDAPADNRSWNFAALFAALKMVFSKDSYIRLGWGLDPAGLDDDILADFDGREVFLYNRNGTSVADALSSEDALSGLSMVSLRAQIKW